MFNNEQLFVLVSRKISSGVERNFYWFYFQYYNEKIKMDAAKVSVIVLAGVLILFTMGRLWLCRRSRYGRSRE